MATMTKRQMKAADAVNRALNAAHDAGLCMRVYDGSVLIMPAEALQDPRYADHGMSDWMEECTLSLSTGINADGGAV